MLSRAASMNAANSTQEMIRHACALEAADPILARAYGVKVTTWPGRMEKRRGAEQGSLHPKYDVSRTSRTRYVPAVTAKDRSAALSLEATSAAGAIATFNEGFPGIVSV